MWTKQRIKVHINHKSECVYRRRNVLSKMEKNKNGHILVVKLLPLNCFLEFSKFFLWINMNFENNIILKEEILAVTLHSINILIVNEGYLYIDKINNIS